LLVFDVPNDQITFLLAQGFQVKSAVLSMFLDKLLAQPQVNEFTKLPERSAISLMTFRAWASVKFPACALLAACAHCRQIAMASSRLVLPVLFWVRAPSGNV
jgi:hypothetical protein